jgi:DNA replication protein DnaC
VDDRHGRKATVVTSQLPVEKWYDIIGDPTFADAIPDRLVHQRVPQSVGQLGCHFGFSV